MEEKKKKLTWQVKYGKKDIKYVDVSEIDDFSGEVGASKDGEVKVEFKNPFYVPHYDSETDKKNEKDMTVAERDMKELIRGIREFGVLVPLIVREKEGKYELLSGHRRKEAVRFINESRSKKERMKVPIVVVEHCDDNRAKFIVSTSNAHRSKISLKERIKSCAGAYRTMCEAEPDKSHGEIAKIIAELCKVRESNVPRYSMLMNLNDGLLDLIGGEDEDENRTRKRSRTKDGKAGKIRLSPRAGVFLATLNEDQQKILLKLLENHEDISISVKTASKIRREFKDKTTLTEDELLACIEGVNERQPEGQSTENKLAKNEAEVEQIGFDDLQSYLQLCFLDKTPQEINDKVHFLIEKWQEAGSPENFEIKSTAQQATESSPDS